MKSEKCHTDGVFWVCLLFIFHFSIFTSSAAVLYEVEDLPNPHTANIIDYVCNPEHILSAATCKSINEIAVYLDKTVEVELVVIAIPAFNEWRYDAEEYARKVFNHWGIGKRGKNTGVMVLLATDSRDIRIQTGGGMEGLLPDATCSRIIEEMKPLLAAQKWDAGILKGVQLIYQELQTPAAQSELLLGWNPHDVELKIEAWNMLCDFMILCCILLIIFSLYVYKHPNAFRQKKDNTRGTRNTFYGGYGGGFGGFSGGGFSGGSFGGGRTFGGGAGSKF